MLYYDKFFIRFNLKMFEYKLCKRCKEKGVYLPDFYGTLDELEDFKNEEYFWNENKNYNTNLIGICKCNNCKMFFCEKCLEDWSYIYNVQNSEDSSSNEEEKVIEYYCENCINSFTYFNLPL